MSKYLPSSVSQLIHIPFLQRKFYLFLFILIILHKNSNSFPALLDESNRSFTTFWEQPQQTSQTSHTTEFNINAQQDEQKPSYFKAIEANLKLFPSFGGVLFLRNRIPHSEESNNSLNLLGEHPSKYSYNR